MNNFVVVYLPLPLVQLSNRVDQCVRSQDDTGALWPLGAHQAMFTQQDLAYVFRTCDSDEGLSK